MAMLQLCFALLAVVCGSALAAFSPVRVIIDTDIGDDIDDSWAIAFLLASPAVDVRLIVTASFNTHDRAFILAKFLHASGVTPPIGIGHSHGSGEFVLNGWANATDLANYPGTVHENGVQAIVDEVRAGRSRGHATFLVSLAPETNLLEALSLAPDIAQYSDSVRGCPTSLVAMGGSIFKGDNMTSPPTPEWNIKCDPAAARAVLNAPWPAVVAPTDVAGGAQVFGESWHTIRASQTPIARALNEMNDFWLTRCSWESVLRGPWCAADKTTCSSVLYDLSAAALLPPFADIPMFSFHRHRVSVRNDGSVIPTEQGAGVRWALDWRAGGLERWQKLVAETIATDIEISV